MRRLILLGPIIFAITLITLTILQYDFMRGLGWHPIKDPTFDWPSGLALGPYGIVMTGTFIMSGLLIAMLGPRLKAELHPAWTSRTGPALLVLSGLAVAFLAFTTDPTIRSTPATWHGRFHDLAFVLLGLTMFPSMIVLGFAFRQSETWKSFSLYTWLTVAFAIPAFILKGVAFYIFLFAILFWIESLAWKLNFPSTQNNQYPQ